ncbi:MAG: hypothetical protein NVV62_13585 [Terricaulis sp.]|nr:hypothetical protein [Terricaulis sp.]
MTSKLPDELPVMPVEDVSTPAQFSINGEHITIELIAARGLKIPLQFARSALATFVSRLTQAHLTGEYIAQTQGRPAEIAVVDAERVNAQSPFGADFVALTVLTHHRMIQHFGITPEAADSLANELRDAAVSARENKITPRH